MTNKLPKKYLHFPDFGDACKAIAAWWAYQDAESTNRSLFNISADGRDTDVCLSDKSLADQSAFIVFLRDRALIETFTVHRTQRVHTWLEGS